MWRTDKLEQFLIIHECHSTGLCTMRGEISIEQIPDVPIHIINGFTHWLKESQTCQNNIEQLKNHYSFGLKMARKIKARLGNEILVDYWWINPDTIKAGEKRHWEGLRIEEKGWTLLQNEYEKRGGIPASQNPIVDTILAKRFK